MSWYGQGAEGKTTQSKAEEEREAKRAQGGSPEAIKSQRFWLPPNKEARVTFLDSGLFFLKEHQIKLNGSFRNWFTCRSDIDTCPFCDAGESFSFVSVSTILDHTEWATKKGKKVYCTKKLFVCKGDAKKGLMLQVDRRGDLRMSQYIINRLSSEDYTTGSQFDYQGPITEADLRKMASAVGMTLEAYLGMTEKQTLEEYLKPFDYQKVFEPLSIADARKVLGMAPPVGSADDLSSGGSDNMDALKDQL